MGSTAGERSTRGQRFLILALLLAFLMPWGLQLVASADTTNADLPACCRRNGAHHCMMSPAARQAMLRMAMGKGRAFHAPGERCPFWPGHLALVLPETIPGTEPPARLSLIPPSARETSPQQAESMQRAAEVRTRDSRGPPALLFSI